MYEFECLTVEDIVNAAMDMCSPFWGECYPVADDSCNPGY